MHYQLRLPPQTPTQETFREKFLGTSKAFAKMKWCGRRKVFADFQGAFYKKPLKARFGTAVPTYNDPKIKNAAMPRFFCVRYQLGLSAPNPGHKGLFVKSPLESQKLHQNKVVYLSKVLMSTFLSRKVSRHRKIRGAKMKLSLFFSLFHRKNRA